MILLIISFVSIFDNFLYILFVFCFFFKFVYYYDVVLYYIINFLFNDLICILYKWYVVIVVIGNVYFVLFLIEIVSILFW